VTYKGFRNQERLGGTGQEARALLCAKYRDLVRHLSAIGLEEARRRNLFRILGAILLLRNLSFVRKTASGVPSQKEEEEGGGAEDEECMVDEHSFEVQKVGELLGLEANIVDLLSKKFITSVRKEDNYFINLSFEQARFHANMLAEHLYDAVFSWLANSHCNARWAPAGGIPSTRLIEYYIDILDFVPLSEFETNGFDQLMTNYCCEKIQKYYWSVTFREELQKIQQMAEYAGSVGNCFDAAAMSDCCLYLLDGEAGILPLIDEHCLLSRAEQNDSTLFQLIYSTHAKHKAHFSRCKSRAVSSKGDRFSVKHYSSTTVTYNIEGFMKCNKGEKLDKELCSAFEMSSNSVLSDMFGTLSGEERRAQELEKTHARRAKSNVKRTEISLMKRKVSQIISDVQSTSPIFIKCIKTRRGPVNSSVALFDSKYVARQLQSHGVADLVRCKMEGFSGRYSWEDMHVLLVTNNLYHFRDQCVLEGGETSKLQCERLAKDLLNRCTDYMHSQFWFERPADVSEKEHHTGASDSVCCVQVDAFDRLMYFKKSSMKDFIYNNFLVHRRKKRRAKETRSRQVLGRFFYSVKLWKQWRRSIAGLLNQFMPMKLFILRWIVQFRVRRRGASRTVILFLNRRVWKGKVRRMLNAERTAKAILHNSKAIIIQNIWRGFYTRHSMYQVVTLVIKEKLLATKHKKMARRIYRFLQSQQFVYLSSFFTT
jgi:hypothetical protein